MTNPITTPESTEVQAPEKVLTWVHWFFFTFVFSAGTLFFYKVYTMLATVHQHELVGFAFDPLIVYACVAMGFFCMLVWAYLSGQFRDVEQPKYEMLERWERQEKQDAALLARTQR